MQIHGSEVYVKSIALFFFTTIILISSWVYADSENVTRGKNWLNDQQSQDGSFYSSGGFASALQVTAEAVSVLENSQNTSFNKAAAAAYVYEDRQSHTEALYWKLLLKTLSSQNTDLELNLIKGSQNQDGGFGSYSGYDSNSLDTAFGLQSLLLVDASNSPLISKALSYLLQRQEVNGAYQLNASNENSLYVTSLVLSVLNNLKFHFSISAEIDKATEFLVTELNNDTSQLLAWQKAMAISTVRQTTVDATGYKTISDLLFDEQLNNGSWQDDAYTTALVLKSSQAVSVIEPPESVTQASVSGRILDRQSVTGLAAAQVKLQSYVDSAIQHQLNANGQGLFQIKEVLAGEYLMEISAPGYLSVSSDLRLVAGKNLELGNVTLEPISDQGIIKGTVLSAEDGMPLSGVSIVVSGATYSNVNTDVNGQYQLSIAPGLAAINVSLSGYQVVSATAQIQAGTISTFSPSLYLEGSDTPTQTNLTGRILDFDSLQALAGVVVKLNGIEIGTSDNEGVFEGLAVSAGEAVIEITLAEYQTATYNATLVENASNNLGDLTIRQVPSNSLTTVMGQIVDATDQSVIDGAEIRIPELKLTTLSDNQGRYTIEGLTQAAFTVEINAVGYFGASSEVDIELGSTLVANASLHRAAASGIEINEMRASTGEVYEAYSEVELDVGFLNTGDKPVSVRLYLKVVNSNGEVVEQYPTVSVPMGGSVSDAFEILEPGVQTEKEVEWHITGHRPDTYNLIVQAYSLEGQLLVERGELIEILPTKRIGGFAGFEPPIAQLADNSPIDISAIIANRGNTNLPPQQLTATVTLRNKGYGPERIDASLAVFLPKDEIKNVYASAMDNQGNYFYLNDAGKELKKRSLDGSITTILTGISTGIDLAIDAQGGLHILTNNSIMQTDEQGSKTVLSLGFNNSIKFVHKRDNQYLVWSTTGLFEIESGKPNTMVLGKGLNDARSVVKTESGKLYVLDYSGEVYEFINGKLSSYKQYSKRFSKLIIIEGERLVAVESSYKKIYELMPDGSLSLIADGFNRISDIHGRLDGIVVSDSSANEIIQLSLDGSKEVIAKSTYTGMNFMAEQNGELYGIRNSRELVKINSDQTVDFIGNVPSRMRSFVASANGGFISSHYNRLYKIEIDGSYAEIPYGLSSAYLAKESNNGELFINSGGSFPIRKVESGTAISVIEGQFYSARAFSKVPDSDHVIVMSNNLEVFIVGADLTYSKIGKIPFSVYDSLFALNENEFIAGDYSGKKLVKFNADGTNETIAELNFRPRYIAGDGTGTLYIAEYYGNRVYKWNESVGLVLYKTLPSPIYYGFTVNTDGDIFYGRSNQTLYKHTDVDESLGRPASTPSQLSWVDGSLLVTSRSNIQRLETDGSFTTFVNTGAIYSESIISVFPISNQKLMAITGSSEVILYDSTYEEQTVVKAMSNSIRDFHVRDESTYALDGNGQIGLFEEQGKLAKPLYKNSSYVKINVLSPELILAYHSGGVDKINPITGEKSQLLSSINPSGASVVRTNGSIEVFDAGTGQFASANISDGNLLESYYDIKAPSFIASDSSGKIYSYQNTHNIYGLENGKFEYVTRVTSPVSFKFLDDDLIVVKGSGIYKSADLKTFSKVVSKVSTEQSFKDVASLSGSNIQAITNSDVVINEGGGLKYYGFGLGYTNDIDVLDSGEVLFSTSKKVVGLDTQNNLISYPYAFSSIKALTEMSNGSVTLLDSGKILYNLDLAAGTYRDIDSGILSSNTVSYTELFEVDSGLVLESRNDIDFYSMAVVPGTINEGDVVYQASASYPGTLNGSPALDVGFGNWVPAESGDYQIRIESDDPSVDGQLLNQIHIGPLATAVVSTSSSETVPGDQVLQGHLSILGADSSAITTIDPEATSFAASSYTRGRAIAADSFGNIYAGDSSRIVIMTPDGDVSDYVTGTLGIRNGMAIDDQNNIYAGTSNGILKVTPDKEISFNNAIGSVNAVAIGKNNVMYAATNSGVYKLTDRETPVLLTQSGLNSPQAIAVDAYENVYVLNSGNSISKINEDGSVSDYYTGARFEYEGVNLVADCSRNLIFAPTYDPIGKPRQSEEDSIVQLMADTRESRLVLKGDLYDSAMRDIDVLYYDRFGDRFLIWTDLASGKIFSFPVICGGIDVELHVTTRTDVDVVFDELLPDEITEVDGKQEIKWSLKNVDVSGVQLPAQFSFKNMQEGETRPVLESGFLRFKNSFDADNPIELPLNIPSVLAVTRVALTGHTDASSYLSSSDVSVSLEFTNESAGSLSGEIQYGIYDGQNNPVVMFDSVLIDDQGPQTSHPVQASWNTGDTIADDYVLKAQFNNSRGELVEAIEYSFAVVASNTPDALGFTGHISTDKVLYEKGETANISTRILNTSANTVADNLIARVRLLDVAGNVVFSLDQTVQSLYPNGVHVKQTPFVLSSVSAGNYLAQLLVIDSVSGQVKTTLNYSFTVNQGGLLGSGLEGQTQVNPMQVNKGQTFTCNHNVSNIGTAETGVTQLRSFVVSAANDELFNIGEQPLNLAEGSTEALNKQYNSIDLPLGGYACVLQANLQGQWQTLTSAGLFVREDPVLSKLIGTVQAVNDEVYFGEPASCLDTITYAVDSGETDVILVQKLVSIDSAMILDSDTINVDLKAQEQQIFSRSYTANQLSLGNYRCDLIAQRNGSEKLIAQDSFTVIEPPIRVSTSLIDGQRGRLLVLTDKARECTALEDINVKVNWEGEFASNASLTIRVFDESGNLVDTELVNQWDAQINDSQSMDQADMSVQASLAGDVNVFLSAPVNKLGKQYHVEIQAKWGWLGSKTKSWDIQSGCDRPFTVGEIIEDVHLLGYKWFHDPSDSVRGLDPYGPVSAPGLMYQNAFIEEQLVSHGWDYTLVHTASDFTQAMRSGDYAAYIVLSERAHLPVLSQKELREHVFAGKGLLVAGSHDNRNLFMHTPLGIMTLGKHKMASGVQAADQSVSFNFPYQDFVQNVKLLGADVELEYIFDGSRNPKSIKDMKRRAVTFNEYGLGQAVFMGLDVLAMATEQGVTSQYAQLLMDQIERVASIQPKAVAYKEWPVVVTINNEGSAVTGTATLTLPQGMELVSSGDFKLDGQVWLMPFTLDDVATANNQYEKTVYVRLPEGDGTQAINLYVDAFGANGGQANVQASLSVSSASAATTEELISLSHDVKLRHWYEPHFYILHADLKLAKKAVEDENWWLAQALLIGATNMILIDTRDDVVALRLAIDEQIRLIGKQL
jgi:hypothetical protein